MNEELFSANNRKMTLLSDKIRLLKNLQIYHENKSKDVYAMAAIERDLASVEQDLAYAERDIASIESRVR